MQSSTTLGDARGQLSWMTTSSADFLQQINQVRNYVINSGLWEGCIVDTVFNGSSTGYITLPPHMEAVVGVTINKFPVPVFNQFHQYVELGPGTLDATKPTAAFLTFAGDAFPTALNHIVGQQLRIRIANAGDAGVVVRIYGTDTNGYPLEDTTGNDGKNLTLVNPVTTLSTSLNTFTGFQKPVTLGAVSVYSWDGVTETLLSRYLASETRPHYSRYFIGQVPSDQPIGCLCKLRYFPVLVDTDWLVPDNVTALELGMQAIDAFNTRNYDNAQQSWNLCFQVLNNQHRSLRGKSQPTLTFLGPGSNRTRIRCN